METKPWLKSKTVWSGVATIITLLCNLFGVDIADLTPELTDRLLSGASLVGTVLTIVFRFRARTVLTKSTAEPPKPSIGIPLALWIVGAVLVAFFTGGGGK